MVFQPQIHTAISVQHVALINKRTGEVLAPFYSRIDNVHNAIDPLKERVGGKGLLDDRTLGYSICGVSRRVIWR